jgi:hypothetical protein
VAVTAIPAWLRRTALTAVLCALATCTGGDRDVAGTGAPCTRDRDCEEGIVCCAGTCAPRGACNRDAGPDAGDAAAAEGS